MKHKRMNLLLYMTLYITRSFSLHRRYTIHCYMADKNSRAQPECQQTADNHSN